MHQKLKEMGRIKKKHLESELLLETIKYKQLMIKELIQLWIS